MTINVPAEYEELVRKAVASGLFKNPEDVVRRAFQLLEQEQECASSGPRKERQGGQWRGRVRIADDFDELPPDLQDAFGMRKE